MKLYKVAGECKVKNCPTVYATDRGTYVVQGDLVAPGEVPDLELPPHEGIVEIPVRLLRSLATNTANEED